jgi:hypothetical protein
MISRVSLALVLLCGSAGLARAETAAEVIQRVLDSDPWGMSGAEVAARAVLTDKSGSTRELSFSTRSRVHAPPLSKTIVRFTAPPDLSGASFLQVQRKDGDDDRFLFLPDLKRIRRISGGLRANAFMGTDFSFADLDRRDLRDSDAQILGEETVGKFACWHLLVKPKLSDSEYAKMELWVRKDNALAVKWLMYDRSQVLQKTLTAEEMRRVGGRWFISRSRMVNHRDSHTTVLMLEKITPRNDIPDDEFTMRALEKG